MRKGRARDYRRWRVAPLEAERFGDWLNPANHEFAPTLREARVVRTSMARGVGLPSSAIGIYDNVTGELKE